MENALRLLEQGRVDDIAPEMMDALEILLNESPEAAGRLEDRPVAEGVAMALPEADVSGEAWEAAWARIESQTDAMRASERRVQRPIWSRWAARLSVAAAIGLAATGSFFFSNRDGGGIALAGPGDALIESVEVFDDSMSFIHSAVDDDDVSIVWVMEETS